MKLHLDLAQHWTKVLFLPLTISYIVNIFFPILHLPYFLKLFLHEQSIINTKHFGLQKTIQ